MTFIWGFRLNATMLNADLHKCIIIKKHCTNTDWNLTTSTPIYSRLYKFTVKTYQ